jgi:predicted DCC family thiol-disulfide oxidoreductase YuxK
MSKTTVLIDAHCVMCNGLARFLRKRVRPSVDFEVHGIDSDEGQELIASFPERLQAMDTVYVVRDGQPYVRSAGAIRLLLCMRWYYAMWFPMAWLVPLPIRDAAYWVVSKIRHRFGRVDG